MTCTVFYAISFEAFFNLPKAGPFKVFSVDTPYDFRLCGLYDKLSIIVFRVAQKPVVVDLHLSLFVSELDSDADVCRK